MSYLPPAHKDLFSHVIRKGDCKLKSLKFKWEVLQ